MHSVRTFVESSAGTGKTERIQCLILSRVLDPAISVEEVLETTLLISFSNTAAAELRNRTQQTFAHSIQALRSASPWRNVDIQAVVQNAAGTSDDKVRRLFEVQAGIDRLTVCTIHSLCKQILNTYPIECNAHTGLVIASDTKDLEEEAKADALAELIRTYDDQNGRWQQGFETKDGFEKNSVKPPTVRRLMELAEGVLESALPLHPATQPSLNSGQGTPNTGRGSHAAITNWFAHEIRNRFKVRRESLGIITVDDLITIVDDALQPGTPLCEKISGLWDYIILDEAQDTDAAQWRILENLRPSTFIAVGDPKQSIFSFRGAHYESLPPLKQDTSWTTDTTLNKNFRSDEPLLQSLNGFFDAGVLHGFQPVQPYHSCRLFNSAGQPESGLFFHRANRPVDGKFSVSSVLENVAEAICQELSDGLLIQENGDRQPLGLRDVAVLVQTNDNAAEIRKHLVRKGVPVATASKASILECDELRELATVFAAIAAPNEESKVLAAALTSIVGFDNRQLNELIRGGNASADRQQLVDTLASLRETLIVQGVSCVTEKIFDTPWPPTGQSARVRILQEPDGERRMKNLLDIGELLTERLWRPSGTPIPALEISQWLLMASARAAQRELIDEVEQNAFSESLATDSDAVRVMTIHAAKGRQFGSVWMPDACYVVNPENYYDKGQPWRTTHHDELVLRPASHDTVAMRAIAIEDAVAEQLRLLYVAGTRARYRTHIVVGAFDLPGTHKHKNRLPLGYFLGNTLSQADDRQKDWCKRYQAEQWLDDGLKTVEQRASQVGGTVVIEDLPATTTTRYSPSVPSLPQPPKPLSVPRAMRLTSFSSLNGLLKAETPIENDDAAVEDDESRKPYPKPTDEVDDEIADDCLLSDGDAELCIPTTVLPGGVKNGDLVHRILEEFLPCPGDTADQVACEARLQQIVLHTADECGVSSASIRQDLPSPLLDAVSQPLGGHFDTLSLIDLAEAGDVTVELPFTFALNTRDPASFRNLRELFAQHDAGSFEGFAAKLGPLQKTDVRGLLTGFIDLVWRHGDGRIALIDYKTNLLTVDGKPTLAAYSQQQLREKMGKDFYLLQAAVYAAAIDAWMQQVQPDWDYDSNFAGVSFAFLRAMAKTLASEPGNGVFHVTVPHSLARGLAEAFGLGGRPVGGQQLEVTA